MDFFAVFLNGDQIFPGIYIVINASFYNAHQNVRNFCPCFVTEKKSMATAGSEAVVRSVDHPGAHPNFSPHVCAS